MTLDERPYSYCYSKNEIRYVFTLADLSRVDLLLQVKIMYAEMGSSSFTELITLPLIPNADGKIYFYLQSYLNSLVNAVSPIPATTITNANDSCRQFYIEYREVDADNLDREFVTTESDHVCVVIKGGIEYHKSSRNNIFINYIESDKPFLTWQPTNRFIYANELVYLSFLNFDEAGFIVKIDMVGVSGAATSYSLNYNEETGFLYHLFLQPYDLELESLLGEPIYYFNVTITDVAGTTDKVNAYRFYIEYRPVYDSYDLVYTNSLGGADGVRVMGETNINYEKSSDAVNTGIDVNEWNSNRRKAKNSTTNILLQRNYKGDIGLIRTKEQQEAFMDILASKNINMVIDTRMIPVNSIQKGQQLGNRLDDLFSFPLEWQLAEQNEVFTPSYKTFGLGSL
ncbi:hypothetical protein [Limnovirga soli]|uniref:Uncharacterized protein n=1 Tax=Limnovirga soli TaxID=2656915 RepID=A0A8J8JSU0_9BACT|nr:hypothetical protein [Limnovirga soli]NNV57362.1 hypothetical protein [Limnovirga soli]